MPRPPFQGILREEGLGDVNHGSDWDLLGQAGLDELPLVLRATRSSARGCPDHLPWRHPCYEGLGHVKHGIAWDPS